MDAESVVSARSERSRHSQGRNGNRRPSTHHRNNRQLTDSRDPHCHFKPSYLRERVYLKPYEDDDATVVTAATSEFGYSLEDFNKASCNNQKAKQAFSSASICFKLRSFLTSILILLLILACFFSPIAMIILPKVPQVNWTVDGCGSKCESSLLAVAFKLIILLLATWAIFFRHNHSFLPRLDRNKALVVFLSCSITLSFWLFYTLKLFKRKHKSYLSVINLSTSFVDILLFLNYLSVIFLEIKKLQNRYVVKLLRSPDGIARAYTVGCMSIQELALWCLHKYYADFQSFNPYLDMRRETRSAPAPSFKLYNIDGNHPTEPSIIPKACSVVSSNHNERLCGEVEHERRTLKRRYRLTAAAEDAFHHVSLIQASVKKQGEQMGSRETAEAIFPTLVRPLQKYLKATRQQPKHSMQSVLEHLTLCLSYRLSHKAFLDKYLSQGEVIFNSINPFFGKQCIETSKFKSKLSSSNHKWVLTSERSVNRDVCGGITFKLTRNNGKINNMNALEVISSTECILVTVQSLPFFDVMEENIDMKNQSFILNMNAELAV